MLWNYLTVPVKLFDPDNIHSLTKMLLQWTTLSDFDTIQLNDSDVVSVKLSDFDAVKLTDAVKIFDLDTVE